jgi:D-alanyl-D-alanine carboxypeptidase
MHLKYKRFLTAVLAVAVLILAGTHPAEAVRHKKHAHVTPPDRFAEIVVEASTGYVLSEKNADKKLYPASLSKMMTLYLTFDAIDRGTLRKNQTIPVSKRAASQEPSSLGLQPGDSIRVEDAILAIATKSANDCAVALAEAVGGSEDRFATLMTARARQLGMRNTHFVNASGLFNPAQVSSARDISILAQALLHDHARDYRYFSTSSFTYKGETFLNHNKLMAQYPGMDGLKTGYVYASGYNLAASAVRNGTRLIGVVFGGRTAGSRNATMAQLLNSGFTGIRQVRVASLVQQRHPKPLPNAAIPDHADIIADNSPDGTSVTAEREAVAQGDTDTTDGSDEDGDNSRKNFIAALQPQPFTSMPLNTTILSSADTRGSGWAIQIGAFASHDAGEKALHLAKYNLRGIVDGTDSIAPLMTPRGMVYRARLAGLDRNNATQACRILKGNCLVLTVE